MIRIQRKPFSKTSKKNGLWLRAPCKLELNFVKQILMDPIVVAQIIQVSQEFAINFLVEGLLITKHMNNNISGNDLTDLNRSIRMEVMNLSGLWHTLLVKAQEWDKHLDEMVLVRILIILNPLDKYVRS